MLKSHNIDRVPNEDLLAKKGSAIRSVASNTTGVVLNSALGVVVPVFLVGAVINGYQLYNSSKNCIRVRREIKDRADRDENFNEAQEKHRKRRNFCNVLIGGSIKTAFCAAGMGIVGVDNIADNFADLGNHAAKLVTDTVGTTPASTNDGLLHLHHSSNDAGTYPAHHRAADFTAKHPHGAAVDKALHKVFSGVGDATTQKIAAATGVPINDNTSWRDLGELAHGDLGLAYRNSVLVVPNGAVQELSLFAAQAGEVGTDAYLRHRDQSRMKR